MKTLSLVMIAGICLLGVAGLCRAQDVSKERAHELRAPLGGDQRLAQAKKEAQSSRRLTKEQEKLGEQLEKAAEEGDLATVKSLLNRGAPINGSGEFFTPLALACHKGHMPVVRLLVERGAKLDLREPVSDAPPLFWAAVRNDSEMVQYLLDKGARDIESGLQGAAEGGSEEMALFFLKKGARKLDGPLKGAASRGDVKMMNLFLQRGAKATGDTLREAAIRGQVPAIKLVLELGVDVNHKSVSRSPFFSEMTALMYAAQSCQFEATEFLLQQGADLNAKTKKGATALVWARVKAEDPKSKDRTQCKAVVDLLRKHGAKE